MEGETLKGRAKEISGEGTPCSSGIHWSRGNEELKTPLVKHNDRISAAMPTTPIAQRN